MYIFSLCIELNINNVNKQFWFNSLNRLVYRRRLLYLLSCTHIC